MLSSTMISTITLFIASALAAPTVIRRTDPFFNFALTNDISGASAPGSVAINAGPVALATIFAGSRLIKDGHVIATSAQNTNPAVQNVFCIFKNNVNGAVIKINDKITFADLDGVADRAVETDVSRYTIECQQ
jgi:hypothetical protein